MVAAVGVEEASFEVGGAHAVGCEEGGKDEATHWV